MRLEQRVGRVDRIGQMNTVQVLNFILKDTVEYRVREVLEQKLEIIKEEFGVDKTGDILDSADAGIIFNKLYMDSIINPERIEDRVDLAVNQIKKQANELKKKKSLFLSEKKLDPSEAQRLNNHPLPYWVERMVINYLISHGGKVNKEGDRWNLEWGNGIKMKKVFFKINNSSDLYKGCHLTLSDENIQEILKRIPRFAIGQPIPCINFSELRYEVSGYWALIQINVFSVEREIKNFMPIFLHDDGRVLIPTSKYIWDQLLTDSIEIVSYIKNSSAIEIFEKINHIIEKYGEPIYEELVSKLKIIVNKEKSIMEYAFVSKKRAIERIGLPSVKLHRINELYKQEKEWYKHLLEKKQYNFDVFPVVILKIN